MLYNCQFHLIDNCESRCNFHALSKFQVKYYLKLTRLPTNISVFFMKTILYNPYKAKEYIYDVIFLEFHIFRFFLKLTTLLWNFKNASLLPPL